MATFVKGDYVQVCPRPDWRWDQWTQEHTNFCEKVCKVAEVNFEQWTNQLFIRLDHRGKSLWFLDHQVVKVDNYEEVFQESIHEAVHQLNETERICKKLRDEILAEAFGDGTVKEEEPEEKTEDELYEDWEEATTKEVIPLPGNGGTMTTPADPKATANNNRKRVRKIKSIGKKIQNKKQSASGSLASSWSLTDEELEDLQDYIDSLPYSNPNTAGDIDFYYDYDGETWNDGNGD